MAFPGSDLASDSFDMSDFSEPPPSYNIISIPPPAYNTAISSPSEPPPSYESLYGRVRAAKSESRGVVEFVKKFFRILITTIGGIICVVMIVIIPFAMIVIGSLYIDDCPKEHLIPIFLIVGGVVGVVADSCCTKYLRGGGEGENLIANVLAFMLIFLVGWFIAGNIWVYGSLGKFTDDPNADDYCHSTVYWFAFGIITAFYSLFGLACLCFCGCCIFGTTRGDEEDDPTSRPA